MVESEDADFISVPTIFIFIQNYHNSVNDALPEKRNLLSQRQIILTGYDINLLIRVGSNGGKRIQEKLKS